MKQELPDAAVDLQDLLIGPVRYVDAVLLTVTLRAGEPGAVMPGHIAVPDRAEAQHEPLVLAEGSGFPVFLLLHPDLFHLFTMLAIAVVHDMPVHDVFHSLDIQRTLSGAGNLSDLRIRVCQRSRTQRSDQRKDTRQTENAFPCSFHVFSSL